MFYIEIIDDSLHIYTKRFYPDELERWRYKDSIYKPIHMILNK